MLSCLCMLACGIVGGTTFAHAAPRVPAFLDCEGPPFDPLWSSFRHAAVKNALAGYPRDDSLRDLAAALIHRFEHLIHAGTRAWVVHLRSAASGDIYQYRPKSDEDGDFFFAQAPPPGKGVEPARGSSDLGDGGEGGALPEEVNPMGFCLYGYIQALFLEYGHSAYSVDNGGADIDSVCSARRGLLWVVLDSGSGVVGFCRKAHGGASGTHCFAPSRIF